MVSQDLGTKTLKVHLHIQFCSAISQLNFAVYAFSLSSSNAPSLRNWSPLHFKETG